MKQSTPTQTLNYPCPICKTPKPWNGNPTRPFCSERCRLIDLGQWASQSYQITANDSPFGTELALNKSQED